jgi:hypothetical protein
MDNEVVEAYVKGKLAGANHYRAKQLTSSTGVPANPCPSSSYMAYVEWDRGFNDGFAQGARGASRGRTANDEAKKAA